MRHSAHSALRARCGQPRVIDFAFSYPLPPAPTFHHPTQQLTCFTFRCPSEDHVVRSAFWPFTRKQTEQDLETSVTELRKEVTNSRETLNRELSVLKDENDRLKHQVEELQHTKNIEPDEITNAASSLDLPLPPANFSRDPLRKGWGEKKSSASEPLPRESKSFQATSTISTKQKVKEPRGWLRLALDQKLSRDSDMETIDDWQSRPIKSEGRSSDKEIITIPPGIAPATWHNHLSEWEKRLEAVTISRQMKQKLLLHQQFKANPGTDTWHIHLERLKNSSAMTITKAYVTALKAGQRNLPRPYDFIEFAINEEFIRRAKGLKSKMHLEKVPTRKTRLTAELTERSQLAKDFRKVLRNCEQSGDGFGVLRRLCLEHMKYLEQETTFGRNPNISGGHKRRVTYRFLLMTRWKRLDRIVDLLQLAESWEPTSLERGLP